MTDITLTEMQAAGVKKIAAWYLQCKNEIKAKKPLAQQVFRVFGFAGAGKSSVVKHALAELGNPNVLTGCFTGKASRVLTQKGTPATTIHSLCYKVSEPSKEAIEKAKEELAKLRGDGPGNGDQMMWRAMMRTREEAIKEMHRPTFVLNGDGPVRDCDLIVLDEVSMVNETMAADLMSFGKPILVLGDPGQLPPIKGDGAFTQAVPDVMLTEIHRQAEGSAIIRLATMAREGKFIPYGVYSDSVVKLRKSELGPEDLLQADQVLTGMNATRLMLNNAMRRASGRTSVLPDGPEEKIICLRNQNDIGLVNGSFLTLSDIEDGDEYGFRAQVVTDDGTDVGRRTIYKGAFLDHVEFDKDRAQRDHWKKKGLVDASFGNAITVHKSQGSGWKNIVWFDDGFGRDLVRNQHAYTAITRAEDGLVILA